MTRISPDPSWLRAATHNKRAIVDEVSIPNIFEKY